MYSEYMFFSERIAGEGVMPIQIGRRPDHGFDQPLGLLSDCHRRIDRFLEVLVAIDQRVAGGPLTPAQHGELETARGQRP